MPQPVRSIEIYLPLDYNDGRPIAESKYVRLQSELLKRFGGVTSTQRQFLLQGRWQGTEHVYQGRVVVFGVMDFRVVPLGSCLKGSLNISPPHPSPLPGGEGIGTLPLLPGEGRGEVMGCWRSTLGSSQFVQRTSETGH